MPLISPSMVGEPHNVNVGTTSSFPVSLVCSNCAHSLTVAQTCGCAAAAVLDYWNDIPRTLFDQDYWGECSEAAMHSILDAMTKMHWREALESVVPGESVHRYLTNPIGPEFVHRFPWDHIENVLDIGAGMGFLSAPLASFGKTVIALEAVPERALFLKRRAVQDGLHNLYPIIGNALELHFPPESFDLITLNGVFEYVGLWGTGNPQSVQHDFLTNVRRLLRPGGYLYIGIETRWAMAAWRGARDHSGLKYTGLMPRKLADLYSRLRRKPFYGSRGIPEGYRTYCHSPRQYSAMLRSAGFGEVEVFGCHPGYNSHECIYPLYDYSARSAGRDLVMPPPNSWRGALLRRLIDARGLYATLENEVILLARNAAAEVPATLRSIRETASAFPQVATSDKILLVGMENGRPTSISKSGKTPSSCARLKHEFDCLRTLSTVKRTDDRLLWPQPIAIVRIGGADYYKYEFVKGAPLSSLLYPLAADTRTFVPLYERLLRSYVGLCGELSAMLPLNAAEQARAQHALHDSASVLVGDNVAAHLTAALDRLRHGAWPLQWVHGDLSLGNIIIRGDELVLIDWETCGYGVVAIDLVRMLYDVSYHTHVLPESTASRMVQAVREITGEVLQEIGVEQSEFAQVEALYVAQQYLFKRSRGLRHQANAGSMTLLSKGYCSA